MIKFKDSRIRVGCLECGDVLYINMLYNSTGKAQRNMGYEYEYTYIGDSKCGKCGETMRLLTTIFEYPKTILNYHETNNEGCVILDDIINDSFIIE